VSIDKGGDTLARRRDVVVLLRLVLGGQGELSHGEIVDASGRSRARFGEWDALVPALRKWLETEGVE
jgi:hypothetical protein